MATPLVSWCKEGSEWNLRVRGKRSVATVFENGSWFTWDRDGVGGENSQEETVYKAKLQAAASAIDQGFI